MEVVAQYDGEPDMAYELIKDKKIPAVVKWRDEFFHGLWLRTPLSWVEVKKGCYIVKNEDEYFVRNGEL